MGSKSAASTGGWQAYAGLFILTGVLVLQNTKQAMLPARQTPWLWAGELIVLAGVLILRSGWGRDAEWRNAQAELGTLANNYYEPRRNALTAGAAVTGGVFGSLFWGLATWAVVFMGMRRRVVGRGLLDFEVAAVAGAIVGGVVGAVFGLAAGHLWETRHRRRRISRQAPGA